MYNAFQLLFRSAFVIDVAVGLATLWALRVAIQATQKKSRTTKLSGPKSTSLLFEVSRELFESPDMGAMFEAWSKEYGVAYEVPMMAGQKQIMVCDPKAVAYLFARDTWSYVRTPIITAATGRWGLLWTEGESHRRPLAPSFNSSVIQKLSLLIYKSVHRANIDANGGGSVVLDVQKCLDSVGFAGFSYDLGSLDGKPNTMISRRRPHTVLDNVVSLISFVFPMAMNVPTWRNKTLDKLRRRMLEVCDILVDNEGASSEQHSAIVRAEDEDTGKRITREEVLAQISTLILASYEITASTHCPSVVSCSCYNGIIICNHLREELLSFGGEPSYNQFTTGLPYLDVIVQETLRLYPAGQDWIRQADEDDVIPLSEPVRTKSGEVVDSIVVERGTEVGISVSCMNRSEAIWGPDAKVFRPDRWLEAGGVTKKAQGVKGFRHLLMFGDGPRTCLGKWFAVAEIKTMLTVVVKNFVLEMRDGPDTRVEITRGITLRPKVAGESGIKVPLRTMPYEG
ncbi:cytochrome P450 [Pisolithus orientalis]|uniref:cytochrome P450 n=1 Tax=Pisolithus orientalis TaxID=936130 RepID=UPI002225602D|nr:cytochrome P450 [Pisolithus orientalis]KAI6004498.1 cytochrome P450 [Pisolithus orientalis]